nr:kielin/chordin-like protein [Onthophagus taurus]
MSRTEIFGILLGICVVVNCLPLSIENTLDEEEEILDDDDDSTTHTLERLSSAATCLVAGVEYTHGQQIYRKDPCEFCLCLDGEMFCWWQDCPPTLEGPCRERSAFSACLNGVKSNEILEEKIETKTKKPTTINPPSTTTIINNTELTSKSPGYEATTDASPSIIISTLKVVAQTCVVMGREYKIGDKLPHDTGNCVECICGAAGQVTCSPNQCSPVGDDINDYRPPGPRTSLSDMF